VYEPCAIHGGGLNIPHHTHVVRTTVVGRVSRACL
jgi:hypothetical protein